MLEPRPEKKVFAAATAAKTIPYVLQPSDTLAQVAEKHHLTVAQLKTLNQYRTFAHGFESVSAGDEIDVPVQSKSSVTDAGSDGSAELAQRAQQAGNFLQNNPSSDSAKDLARGQALGAANSKANQEVASWLNGKGKARVKLDADRDFSLKILSWMCCIRCGKTMPIRCLLRVRCIILTAETSLT